MYRGRVFAKCGFCVGFDALRLSRRFGGLLLKDMTDSLRLPSDVDVLLTEQSESLPDGRERLVAALGAWNLRLLGGLTGG